MAETTTEIAEDENIGAFIGPEGIMMMGAAILVDGGEFLVEFIPAIGWIISILIDLFAIIFIGTWMYIRSGVIKVPQKTAARIAKITTKTTKWAKRLKWLRPLCFILECIPIVGSILPLWILIVYLELKYS